MLKRPIYIFFCAVTLLLIAGLVLYTDPFEGGPLVVISFLVLLFALFFQLTMFITHLVARNGVVGRYRLTRLTRYYSSLLIASGGVYLVGLLTIAQLQLIDLILVISFELIANFYVYRRL